MEQTQANKPLKTDAKKRRGLVERYDPKKEQGWSLAIVPRRKSSGPGEAMQRCHLTKPSNSLTSISGGSQARAVYGGVMFQKADSHWLSKQCMEYKTLDKNNKLEVTSLFTSVFASSAGEEEGKLIGSLASELSSIIDNQEIICFGAYEDESLIASIFFTRLRFNDGILLYMLAPVAVSTEHQGKGVGQALIQYGPPRFVRVRVMDG